MLAPSQKRNSRDHDVSSSGSNKVEGCLHIGARGHGWIEIRSDLAIDAEYIRLQRTQRKHSALQHRAHKLVRTAHSRSTRHIEAAARTFRHALTVGDHKRRKSRPRTR